MKNLFPLKANPLALRFVFAAFIVAVAFVNGYSQSACINNQVVINEIYTDGGLTAATYTNDFVELYNVSGTSCSLSNFSIQVSTGNANNFPNVFAFPTGSVINSTGFFLIKFGSGGSVGSTIPAPDFTATLDLNSSGKIALVASVSSLVGNCSSNLTNSLDYVGYGSTNCFLGAGSAGSPTPTSSAQRLFNGYNTDNNNADFTVRTPTPRNTLSPTASSVTVSGTLTNGKFLVPNARVYMTNQLGFVSSVRTNQFGKFQFDDVAAGEIYVFTVRSKYGSFQPVVVTVQDNISDLSFELAEANFRKF